MLDVRVCRIVHADYILVLQRQVEEVLELVDKRDPEQFLRLSPPVLTQAKHPGTSSIFLCDSDAQRGWPCRLHWPARFMKRSPVLVSWWSSALSVAASLHFHPATQIYQHSDPVTATPLPTWPQPIGST